MCCLEMGLLFPSANKCVQKQTLEQHISQFFKIAYVLFQSLDTDTTCGEIGWEPSFDTTCGEN